MVHLDRSEGKMAEVTCSFCRGHGTDPFGIMSWHSTCCVCGGRGVVQVPASRRRCAHCRGTGAIKTFTCTVCRGRRLCIRRSPAPCKTARSAGEPETMPPRPWPA